MNDATQKLVVKHPNGWRCSDCQYYLTDKEARMAVVQTPQGMQQIPEEFAIKQGMPIGSYYAMTMAPCVLLPNWSLVHRDHWCAHFEPPLPMVPLAD